MLSHAWYAATVSCSAQPDILLFQNRLQNGLRQLEETNKMVITMRTELVELGPQIEAKAGETERLLVELKEDQVAVEEVRAIVQEEEAVMQKETQVVEQYAQVWF